MLNRLIGRVVSILIAIILGALFIIGLFGQRLHWAVWIWIIIFAALFIYAYIDSEVLPRIKEKEYEKRKEEELYRMSEYHRKKESE